MYVTIPYLKLKKYYKKKYHDKIKIIPQGLDFRQVRLAEYRVNPVPTFAYAGTFMKHFRDPRLFLTYLSKIKADFKFIAYTNKKGLISGFTERLSGKLEIREYIPRLQLIYELSRMDFLINIQNGNKKDYPSKLIDYTLTKRPVLEINSFVLDEAAIMAFFKRDFDSYNAALKNIDQYDIERVAEQFLGLLESQ
jgi:hypothetical protein